MELLTKDKIIFALLNKSEQTFKELRTSARTNDNSLSRALDYLKKEKLIKQDGKLYSYSAEIKNPFLRSLKGSYSMIKKLDGFVDDLKTGNIPFEAGGQMVGLALLMQSRLKVERYSSNKLSKRDKLEFDLYGDIFDGVIELVFDVLKKKDPHKFSNLKRDLIKIMAPSSENQ